MHSCPQCTSASLVTIGMTLNGGPVSFFHCRNCEHRWWVDAQEGRSLGLRQVLDKAAAAA